MQSEAQAKTVSHSRMVLTQLMLPQDTNPAGHIHGGVILKYIDTAGGIVAMRHCSGNAVTAAIDRVDFLKPVHVGELVHFRASLNWVGRSSMEVGVSVWGENIFTGEMRHTASAYLTYVALDMDGKPTLVPPLLLETEDDKRRNKEAAMRQELWKKQKLNMQKNRM